MTNKERFDPDTRFLLANERTLLAWIRTSIAMQAGGLALAHFGTNALTQKLFSAAIVVLGGSMAVVGYLRFQAADRAIRTEQLPSIGHAPLLQTIALSVIAICLIIGVLFGLQ